MSVNVFVGIIEIFLQDYNIFTEIINDCSYKNVQQLKKVLFIRLMLQLDTWK